MHNKLLIILAIAVVALVIIPNASAQYTYELRSINIPGYVTIAGGTTPVLFAVCKLYNRVSHPPIYVAAVPVMDQFTTTANEDSCGFNVYFPGGWCQSISGSWYYVEPFTFTIKYNGPYTQQQPVITQIGIAYWTNDGATRVIRFDGYVGRNERD